MVRSRSNVFARFLSQMERSMLHALVALELHRQDQGALALVVSVSAVVILASATLRLARDWALEAGDRP